MKTAYLYLENGVFIQAKSFGAQGTQVGEVVFNTSITGYQEIITDPSYAGQFVTFTMPEIGIVGTNPQDNEREIVHCKGIFVRKYQDFYSNFRSKESLKNFLIQNNIMGICEIDTRGITQMLREQGAMMAIVSTEISNKEELAKILASSKRIEEINYIQEVSIKNEKNHTQGTFNFETLSFQTPDTYKTIVAIDFGAKDNILNELVQAGLNTIVKPHNFDADEIIALFDCGKIHGVFLSNGPGDPMTLTKEVEQIKKLILRKIPIFGICLGHQLLSIAYGYPTKKLKFGHHGGNHPVKNLKTNTVEITAQNHNYSVTDAIREVAEITHINLFDGTIEGVRYKDSPIFSVQYHPEASPGPKDSAKLFREFAQML
ncbi:carbamoyl-phosphate synthase small subunit [Helicobacter cholecystus]|uniref:Carbamoyl phosphate synthase small chain n=1 Tax=Helicobacter cholecystus TaxID=45498 RepID=A0A3D8IXB1_9HELI|nr:glutamine-hydrolyzing carbamoyl-phosphate synthase small subunit [Helicobacter cholecystus]RDU69620.1 carbamoyl-phosphate synthase small subunit [Helicobacter cholecystus]VEJ24179.1 carbamoyl-phosphate synthase small subunit [Helicobacter cholecystus]